MKKISVILILMSVLFVNKIQAASIRFLNSTGCIFKFYSVAGYFPTTPINYFSADSASTIIPANNLATPLVYLSPDLLPGFAPIPSSYTGPYNTGRYHAIKFIAPNGDVFGLDDTPGPLMYTVPTNPGCYSGPNPSLTVMRLINPVTGDWTVSIF